MNRVDLLNLLLYMLWLDASIQKKICYGSN